MNEVRVWVHPKFKRKLKREAADRDLTVVKLTEELAEDSKEMLDDIKKEKKGFSFRI